MAADHFDLADVKALLASGNPVIQSNGLSRLLSRLKLPFHNTKEKISAVSLFFDGFTKYGDVVTQWCVDSIPCLIDSDIITIEEVRTQCFVKLSSDETKRTYRIILVRLLLHLSEDRTSTSFEIIRKCRDGSDLVVAELISYNFEKSFPTLKILLLSGVLSEGENVTVLHYVYNKANADDFRVVRLLEYLPWKFSRLFITKFKFKQLVTSMLGHCTELSPEELQSLELSVEDVFHIADNLLVNPLLLMNETFPASHVLLPSMLSLYASRSDLAKSFPNLIPSDQLVKIKTTIAQCQAVRPLKTVVLENNWCGSLSTFTYMEYIASASNITTFMDSYLSNLDSIEVSWASIVFFTALLPYCGSSLKKYLALINGLVSRSPEHANSIFLFLTTLYAKPFFRVDRATILHSMRGLLVHKFLITPAINFLSIVCRQPGEERDIAFSLIGDLVSKFPTTFDAVKSLAVTGESDSLDLLNVKLKLMSSLCISTDRSDELLPSLTSLLKKNAEVVAAAVSVVVMLCKEEILDINSIRKQLAVKVRQPGYEAALVGFCEILAAAATQSGKSDDGVYVEFVQELWEITQLRTNSSERESARRQAWIALGRFDIESLKSTVNISGRHLIGQFLGMPSTERKGFATFLHKLVSAEVESLSRTLYTKVHDHKTLLGPLVSSLHNSLGEQIRRRHGFGWQHCPFFR
ncbi:hypothetical protein KIN20_016232 [Parelaphostrongylus tenuis]|uniref:Uncharacterized protein n=1 Tax=Parelaphostrongylus tenuis TaxID=148309 RepID=A0AAD5QT24_PARTN|nr:hypothetical protein KIN20_016232 [Parelaphostrongylus tenuis]